MMSDTNQVLPHEERMCLTVGCDRLRAARAVLYWNGLRRTVTACPIHIDWYVARAMSGLLVKRHGVDVHRRIQDGEF